MILCQNCTHNNPYDRETCIKCGMRLMIITESRSSAAFGGADLMIRPTIEEHLLERISGLETALLKMQDRVDILLELIHRQATSGLYDHAMIDALVEHLSERGAVEGGKLETLWRDRVAEHYEEASEKQRYGQLVELMINEFNGDNIDLFARLLDTGTDLFLDGNARRGIRYFEKALVIDPTNSVLSFFIGEYFFRINKPALSQLYLERAINKEPDNHLAMLMLGVICGDNGELESAKNYLNDALKLKQDSFTAHYGLGRILACEGKLREAISHLKRALKLKPTPEMYYLVGRAYLDDGRAEIALRHLQRCVDLDPKFDAALYHLGLIYLKRNEVSLAQEHFLAAYEINPREPRYRIALNARKAARLTPLPAFGRAKVANRKVVTSGDVRLAELLRRDLLDAGEVASKGQKRS
ncbi:MAG: tetratricopeptide repeat protein [Acidobacteriota bacterium]